MPKPESSLSATFLHEVECQLGALEPSERREILNELATHLHDRIAAGASEAEAVRAMGNPVAIGRRLRVEHQNGRLSLPAALLCALPLAAIALLFRESDLYYTLRNFSSPSSGFPFSYLLALTPIIALSLIMLACTRQSWPAALLGGAGVMFLLGSAHGLRGSQHALLGFAILAMLLLAIVALALGIALRFGRLRAMLVLLGGVGVYGCYAWLETAGPTATIALSLCPIFGVLAVALGPQRRQWLFAWGAFALNWALIILVSLHAVREQPTLGPGLSTFDFISPAFLVASAALLAAVQGVSYLQANGRLTLPGYRVR